MHRAIALIYTCLLSTSIAYGETYEEKRSGVDDQNADELYDLAMWCKDNKLKRKSMTHLREAIRLDPDHGPARDALGFVYYREKWVHKARVPAGALAKERAKEEQKLAGKTGSKTIVKTTGPGPKPADIDWGLEPIHAEGMDGPKAEYLKTKIMSAMNRAGNYTNAMDSGFRTLLLPEYWQIATALLADGLKNGWYSDIYGPAMMIVETRRARGLDDKVDRLMWLEKLLPYIGHAAGKVSDKQDLQMYCLVAAESGDKRHIPRILELMRDSDSMVVSSAKLAMSKITLLPERDMTPESAQKWWDKYHASSNSAIYGQMISDKDPNTRLAACKMLYREQDKSILPVLAGLCEPGMPRPAAMGAVNLIKRITGTDFGLADLDAANRDARVQSFRDWIANESHKFTWVEFRGGSIDAGPKRRPVDKSDLLINQLTDLNANQVRIAENGLRNLGAAAYPKLVAALDSKSVLKATKVRDLLREMTKQNFGFDPLKSGEERQAAIAKWQAFIGGGATEDEGEAK